MSDTPTANINNSVPNTIHASESKNNHAELESNNTHVYKNQNISDIDRARLVDVIIEQVKPKIESGKIHTGSSVLIRNAMEVAAGFLIENKKKKDIVMDAIKTIASEAPDAWVSTVAVASEQIDELYNIAQGLSTLNANSTLREVKERLDYIAASKTAECLTSCCLPFCKNQKK